MKGNIEESARSIEKVKQTAIKALFSDDGLVERFYLKGGNALDLFFDLPSRSSMDIDISMEDDFEQDDIEAVSNTIKNWLERLFSEEGFVLLDYKFMKKPKTRSRDIPAFWKGYEINFKVVRKDIYAKHKNDIQKLRRLCQELDITHKKTFKSDISGHEYCSPSEDREFQNFYIRVYTAEMIIAEKLRAICQQMKEYQLKTKRAARGRDFYDIYILAKTLQIDFTGDEFLKILRKMFYVKEVEILLLKRIENYRELHRTDFPSIRDSLKPDAELESFDLYFDYVLNVTKKLLEALGIE